jgi:hypothetical protein
MALQIKLIDMEDDTIRVEVEDERLERLLDSFGKASESQVAVIQELLRTVTALASNHPSVQIAAVRPKPSPLNVPWEDESGMSADDVMDRINEVRGNPRDEPFEGVNYAANME